MELKPEIAAALGAEESERVLAALADLNGVSLNANERWRVTQLNNAFLVKPAEDLDE